MRLILDNALPPNLVAVIFNIISSRRYCENGKMSNKIIMTQERIEKKHFPTTVN